MVWWATALHACVLLAHTLLAPPWRGPDEPMHVDRIRAVAARQLVHDMGGRLVSAEVLHAMARARLVDPDTRAAWVFDRLTPAQAVPRGQRASLAELAPDQPTPLRNQMVQHPPVAYLVGAGVYAALPETLAHDRTLGALRLLSVGLVLPVPALLAAAVGRFTGPGPLPAAAATAPLLVPQLSHIGATVNNDAALIALAALATWGVARLLTGARDLRTGLLLAAAAGVAALVKGFGLVLIAWVGVVGLVAAWRDRAGRGASAGLRSGSVALGGALAISGWWWVRNLVRYGTLQPAGSGAGLPGGPEASAPLAVEPAFWVSVYLPQMVQRFWGSFGFAEVELPAAVVAVGAALLGLAVAAALLPAHREPARRREPAGGEGAPTPSAALAARQHAVGWRPADAALLCLPAAVLLVAVATRLGVDAEGTVRGIQGRYLFTGLAGLLVAATLGAGRLAGRWVGWLPLGVVGLAGVLQAVAARAMLGQWWDHPEAGVVAAVRTLSIWAPWPSAAQLGLAVGTVAAAAGFLWAWWRAATWRAPAGRAGSTGADRPGIGADGGAPGNGGGAFRVDQT